MSRNSNSLIGQVDWILVALYFLLVLLGIANLYSSAYSPDHPGLFDLSQEYGKQIMWAGLCAVLAIIILIIDSQFWNTFAFHIYGVVLFLLLCVLIFGAERNGAKSWFGVGAFGIQPSEFAKFATALVVAKYLSMIGVKIQDAASKIFTAGLIGAPAFLILLQPDAGTLLVFMAFILVMYREGLSGNILLIGLSSGVVAILSLMTGQSEVDLMGVIIPGQYVLSTIIFGLGLAGFFLIRAFVLPRNRRSALTYLILGVVVSITLIFTVNFVFQNALMEHQRDRIELTLGLKVDPEKSYNVDQALSAIGSGRVIGKGYREGTLSNNQYKWVPMQSTDFIFCSIGEEWGFVGASIIIILFTILLIRIIMIAERQRSKFTRIYGYSVACILFFHLLINVGMAIGLAPVIGIPLPFFSYGGSSLLGFTILLFVFIKLDADRLAVLR